MYVYLELRIVSKHVFTTKIWDLPTNEIDAVTITLIFREHGILPLDTSVWVCH